jgi:hypothetical protein
MLNARLLVRLALIALPFVAFAKAQQLSPAEPGLLAERRPAAFANGVIEALQDDQPAQAYLHARAWKRVAPGEIAPLTAFASVYLAFDAPAAALDTLDAALALEPDPAETRRILALKIQTHARMADYPAAWANARSYLRTAAPDDAFAPLIAKLQWTCFAPIVATAPFNAVIARTENAPEKLPLTAAQISTHSGALTARFDDACNRAYKANNEAAIAEATTRLLRYLLVAHYVKNSARPDRAIAPLYDYPNVLYVVRDLAGGDNPSGIALSLLQWAPQRHSRELNYASDTEEEPATDEAGDALREEIRTFLAATPAAWRDLQQSFTQQLRAADAARTASEIETVLRDLILLQQNPLASLKSHAISAANRLRAWQAARTTPAPATDTTLLEQLDQWAKTFESATIITGIERRLSPALPGDSPDAAALNASLPHRLAQLLLREADEAWSAPLLAFKKIPSPRLEDFDELIARGLMTPGLWSRRLDVARQLNDWTEIAWSGVETRTQDPGALAAWLAPLISENDAHIARALQSLTQAGDAPKALALADLETGLLRDPGHLAGLQTLYQSYLDRGDDSTAALILESLWRLSPADFAVSDETLALAARAGRWPLLLSLADYRIARSDTDLAAHLHRQVAAIALGYGGLAADSTPALDGTVYTNHARVLHSMAYELKTQSLGSFSDPLTGLESTYKLLGLENDDPVVRLWLGLGTKLTNRTFNIGGVKWEKLVENVSPAMKTHLDFIRETPADSTAYLASFQGTAEEGTALFVHHFIEAELRPTTANRDALAALADRPDLPLFFRAKAAGAGTPTAYSPNIPLRASDPYYTAAATKNWDAVWATLAPGQQLIALGDVQLPRDTATLPVLRLSRPPRHPLVPLSNTQNYNSRLWELDGVKITTRSRYGNPWQIAAGAVAALTRCSLTGSVFGGEGSLWIENSDFTHSSGQLGQLFQSDVKTVRNTLAITHRWEADLLRAEENTFQLGARAIVNNSLFVNHQSEPFKLLPAAALEITASRFYTQKPLGLAPAQTVFKNSRVTGAAQPALASATGVEITPLNLTGPADRTVATAADLRQALGATLPGQRIDVSGGRILLDDGPIQVPHGVILRGSSDPKNPTILSVTPARPTSPLIITHYGDSWIENLTLDVEKTTQDYNGRQLSIADRLSDRKALVAQHDSRPLLRNITFVGWSSLDRERHAIVSEGAQVSINGAAPRSLLLKSNGRIDHIGSLDSAGLNISGSGEAYFSYAAINTQVVSGPGVRFYGSPASPGQLVYRDGAGDARTLAWRAVASQNLRATLARLKEQLPAQLKAAPDLDARIALFRNAAARLGPLARAAQLNPQELAGAFASGINTAMSLRPDEFPYYMDAFHHRSRSFGQTVFVYAAHSQTFPPALRDRLKAHLNALVGIRQIRGGEFTSADRGNLMALMRNYPVGSPNHARAMAAFNRGVSATAFQQELQQEADARRRAAEYAAKLKRQQQLEWDRQRLAAQTPPAPVKKSWWENYQAQYPNGRYNSSNNSSGGSASQQMRNYLHDLDKKIYNAGRDYGDMRVY